MDRNAEDWLNAGCLPRSLSARRAWIEIRSLDTGQMNGWRSLSARRAWIEIRGGYITKIDKDQSLSARRAWIEMRDVSLNYKEVLSLSARRAWIEIICTVLKKYLVIVALRKESVDRNFVSAFDVLAISGRSPQGERG